MVRYKVKTTVILLACLSICCGQKDPTGVIPTGSIYVTSSVSGATISLDNKSTGQITPSLLTEVRVGEHTVSVDLRCHDSNPSSRLIDVEFDQEDTVSFTLSKIEQRIILLEDFSNTGCLPCVESDSIVTAVLDLYGTCQLVGIQYHVFWPDISDPFYIAAKEENDARRNFYQVAEVPFLWIDGVTSPEATNAGAILNAIEARLSVESPVELRVRNEINGTTGLAEAEIVVKSDVPQGHYHLLFVLLEGDIAFNAPNSMDHFDNVLRMILPDLDGVMLDLSLGDTLEFNSTEYTIDPGWDEENLSVVAFIQDDNTKEVLQAATSLNP
jgi:hypothetical protein